MRAGKLRHCVDIQQASEVTDEEGMVVATWLTVEQAWMSLEPMSGAERFAAQQVQAGVTHVARMRLPQTNVTPKMRILLGTRELGIESVVNVEERGRELELMLKEPVG